MISTGPPQEFVPRGRALLPVHPKTRGSSFQTKSLCTLWTSAETEFSRDLFKALRDINIHDDVQLSRKEDWLLRRCAEGEEELYYSDNVVIWSFSDGLEMVRLIKTFTLEKNIYQAIWCNFNNDSGNNKTISSICTVDTGNLEIFCDDGNHYPIALQFQVNKIYSTCHGILLERLPMNNETGESPLPLIFSLTHPLKEIAPVIFKLNSQNKMPYLKYLTLDFKFKLIDVIEDRSLLVFYKISDGAHFIFLLRPAKEEEVKSARYKGASTINEFTTFSGSAFLSNDKISTNPSFGSTPFRSLSTKHSNFTGISSPSVNPSLKSTTNSSSSSVLSPLRSSRLAASPASPNLRSFGSPLINPTHTGSNSDSHSKNQTFQNSPLLRSSLITPQASRDFSSDDISDPIVPELTLEHIWNEPMRSSNEKASKAFFTVDFLDQTYFALFLRDQNQLKLIKVDQSNDGQKIIFGAINYLFAKEVESISHLKMILVVDNSNALVLYSGTSKITSVYIPYSVPFNNSMISSPKSADSFQTSSSLKRISLTTSSRPSSAAGINPFLCESRFLSPVLNESSICSENESFMTEVFPYNLMQKINSIRDPVENRISICCDDNLYRFTIPQISTSFIVTKCISALKSILPKDATLQLLIKWYILRNSSNFSDFTSEDEFELFKSCLMSMIGYEIESSPIQVKNPAQLSPSSSPEIIKKIKLDLEESSDEDWKWLSELDNKTSNLNRQILLTPSVLFQYLPSILFSLHLVYEEFKLRIDLWKYSEMLADMLFLFATDLKLISFQDHYFRDYPTKCNLTPTQTTVHQSELKFLTPTYFKTYCPSIYSTLRLLITNQNNDCIEPFPYIIDVNKNIRNLILLFANVGRKNLIDFSSVLAPINSNVKMETEISVKTTNPDEKVVVIMNQLDLTQEDLQLLPPGLAIPLWDAVFNCRQNPPTDWDSKCFTLIGRPDLATMKIKDNKLQVSTLQQDDLEVNTEVDEDGINFLDNDVVKLLFPNDQRINEASSMLLSSKPVKIAIQQRQGVSDHEFIEEQERHLYSKCIRTMALPLGRAMLTFRSYVPVVAETFPIPKLNLVGRVPPRNNTIDLSHIEVPPNMNTWPLFHNGVAAGLRASLNASGVIDSTWIVYNRPKSNASLSGPNDAINEHAGFLLALGLNGHLARLSTMNIHDYLCKGSELTRVSVLLGLAAAKRGTMDVSAVKVLSIHVEALLPPTSTELDVPPIVQVAAVLGIGLLYQSSGQHHISEVLLNEIGRPPGPEMEHYIDRESYALASGLAFGLVTLGKGNSMIGLVASSEGMSMADQLCHYMLGGYKRPLNALQREKYKTPSYQIREGDCINADVTSPGATLALGMMFFNTNNSEVAKWVEAPDTQHLLEMVRPDFLLLRALCSGLIMWNHIEPSTKWVESHITPIVINNAFNRNEETLNEIDAETMSQAFCNIVAGACFALSLKYAGSANESAFKTVMNYTNQFISLTNKPLLAEQAGRSTIESCLNVLVVSLAIIMAGTGNLEVMRICRFLRSRLNQAYVLYGSHMATHMALGLLFLSGCRFTLSSSPEAVAALICAFFPKYPIHSNDNRYHLQAFRHLWVLAAEPRLVIPRDIDTKKAVYVQMKCRFKDSDRALSLVAPCFLPELSQLQEVVVDDQRYWFVLFEKDKNWTTLELFLKSNGVLFVKQKVGCLPYKEDPKGFKSFHAQSMMKDSLRGWSYKLSAASEFSNDTIVINYSKLLLSNKSKSQLEAHIQQMFCSILFDCASNERVEMLQLLMRLVNIATCGGQDDPLALWQIKFANSMSMSGKFRSLKSDLILALQYLVEYKLKEHLYSQSLVNYLNGNASRDQISADCVKAMVFFDIPPFGSLSEMKGKISLPEIIGLTRPFLVPISTCIKLAEILNNESLCK